MADILLLGAGFSRNWGGLLANEVFEHLLANSDIHQNVYLKDLLWRFSNSGGFEYALSEVQTEYSRHPERAGPSLHALQAGIAAIFEGMNDAFFDLTSMEFSKYLDRQLKTLFVRFDAIFTLNQDILIEQHYLPHVELAGADRWNGVQIPGMKRTHISKGGLDAWGKDIWVPMDSEELTISERMQPFFKLHGSSNWKDAEGGQLFVAGGNKSRTIESQAVLAWYYDQFRQLIAQDCARLLVIGYSFRDDHINRVIIDAVRSHGLKFFVIDPLGSDVVRHANPSYGGDISGPNELDDAFKTGLVGASRRSLWETFGTDAVSHGNVTRFLQ